MSLVMKWMVMKMSKIERLVYESDTVVLGISMTRPRQVRPGGGYRFVRHEDMALPNSGIIRRSGNNVIVAECNNDTRCKSRQ